MTLKKEDANVVPGGADTLSGEVIARDPEILEGKPYLVGTRMGVHSLVGYWQTYAGDMERILREFPHLTREQIEAALAFYEDASHRAEIDRILSLNRSPSGKDRARQIPSARGL